MIVACKSTSDLNNCVTTLGTRDEYKIFKAECKDPCYSEVRSFYGIYVTNEKVTTSIDDMSKEILQNRFPFIDPEIIEKVMIQQGRMTSCCDVLSSLVSSHGSCSLLLDSTLFVFKDFKWPSIKESILKACCTEDVLEGWSICELDSFDALAVTATVTHPTAVITQEVNIVNDGCEMVGECDWELVDAEAEELYFTDAIYPSEESNDIIETVQMEDSSFSIEIVALSNGRSKTYRDMLLIPKLESKNMIQTQSNREKYCKNLLSDWKPRFQLFSAGRKRIDRDYGTERNFTNAVYDEYEDEGMEDIIAGELGSKIHAGVSRVRAVTMLPPKILEKKLQRIAEKQTANSHTEEVNER